VLRISSLLLKSPNVEIFVPEFCILEQDYLTRRKFSDKLKFGEGQLPISSSSVTTPLPPPSDDFSSTLSLIHVPFASQSSTDSSSKKFN